MELLNYSKYVKVIFYQILSLGLKVYIMVVKVAKDRRE